jgi:signal transduction histidine kinase
LAGESAIEVRVADSGMGIPTDKLNRIFDAFYTTKRDGTGLGLSVARTIVETYGFNIEANVIIGADARPIAGLRPSCPGVR